MTAKELVCRLLEATTDYFHGVRPVVCDTEGHRYYGWNHADCIAAIPADKQLDVEVGDFGHAFEKEDGTIITREEAARLTGLPTNIQHGKLHSEDLHWEGPPGPGTRPELFVKDTRGGIKGFDEQPSGQFEPDSWVAHDEWERAEARKATRTI